MKKRTQWIILIFIILFTFNSSIILAEENILNTFFKPFEDLDIAGLYDNYSVIIDLIIFLTIFLGLSQAVLSKKFQGRGVYRIDKLRYRTV